MKISSLILLLLLCCSSLLAETPSDSGTGLWVQAETSTHYPSRVEGFWQHNFGTSEFGAFVYLDAESDGYKEGYLGPSWKPVEWLQMGFGLGHENVPKSSIRKAFWIELNMENFHTSGSFEKSSTGTWHEETITYKIFEEARFGIMERTRFGIGPRLEWNPSVNTQLWVAILSTGRSTGLTVGFNQNF